MITTIGFYKREYTHYILYGSIYRIAIIRLLSSLFLAHFYENGNICAAIKSGSTVYHTQKYSCCYWPHFFTIQT